MNEKEKLKQVQQNLFAQAEDIRQFLDESEETYFRNFKAEIVSNDRVNVTWESNQEGLFDIEYYRPNQDREWQHSVAKYRELIPIQDLETSIGFNSDVTEVKFRAVLGGEVVEEFSAKTEEKEPENPNPPEDPKPPTKPDIPLINQDTKWENHGIVIPTGRFAGRDYTIAGVFRRNDEIGVVYQSKHNQADTARTAGSVAFSADMKKWMGHIHNPVIRQAMSWQGVDAQGRAHRTGAATVVDIDGTLYCYYRDREGRAYTSLNHGMRAMGVAHSENGVDWAQEDYPFMTVRDVKRIIPSQFFTGDPVFRRGRVYINYATYADGYVYAIISTLVNGVPRPNGEYGYFMIRGKDPLKCDQWEFVRDGVRNADGFIKVAGKWLYVSRSSQSGEVGFNLQIMDKITDSRENEIFIPSGRQARSIVPFWDEKLYIFYSDRGNPDNIHLIEQL